MNDKFYLIQLSFMWTLLCTETRLDNFMRIFKQFNQNQGRQRETVIIDLNFILTTHRNI